MARKWLPSRLNSARRLARLRERCKRDVLHALEIQHAGYLVLACREYLQKTPPWIVTNWGSDTYHFRHFDEHLVRLKQVFASCDYYDCECERDVIAARELGFK